MSVLVDIIVAILASEAHSNLPWLQRKILRFAVALLAPTDRALRFEEWEAVLLDFDVPGEVWRTGLALGFLWTGMRYRGEVVMLHLKDWCMTCIRLGAGLFNALC